MMIDAEENEVTSYYLLWDPILKKFFLSSGMKQMFSKNAVISLCM